MTALLNRPEPETPLPIGNPPHDVQRVEETDRRMVSVTSVLKAYDKPPLRTWFGEQVADAAIRVAGTLAARIEEEGPDAVREWLVEAPYRRPKGERSTTQLGTDVHAACERYAISGVRPETDEAVRPYLDQFDRWCQRVQPVCEGAEITVYSPTLGYAGCADAMAGIDGTRYLLDYKSSHKSADRNGNPTRPWPEVAPQDVLKPHTTSWDANGTKAPRVAGWSLGRRPNLRRAGSSWALRVAAPGPKQRDKLQAPNPRARLNPVV
jgi:hypothetical protein